MAITIANTNLEFAARADDPEPHGVEIFNACKAGTYGTIGDYVAPEEDE